MKTAVMTDSNSGITPEEGKKIGIYSLPMPVIIEGDVFYEGKNITQEEYYGAMTSGKNVTTSQPSPGDVMDMWDGILKEGYEQVVYIPMSSALSASINSLFIISSISDHIIAVMSMIYAIRSASCSYKIDVSHLKSYRLSVFKNRMQVL